MSSVSEHSPVSPLENYIVGKAIGRGHFSVVYKAKDKRTNLLVALKKINLFEVSADAKEKTLKEVELLKYVEHPHIIRCFDSFLLENDLVIVTEFAEHGDLAHYLKKAATAGQQLSEPLIWRIFSQIVSAVQHMHKKRVMHRDIKPSNILVTGSDVMKVADLGLGRVFGESMESRAFSRVGTPLYMAPEVLSADGYGFSSDLWSLGCVLYELAAGISPFKEEGLTLVELVKRVRALHYRPFPDSVSERIRVLVKRLLVTDPRSRPSIDEVSEYAATAATESMLTEAVRPSSAIKTTPTSAAADRTPDSPTLVPSHAQHLTQPQQQEQQHLSSDDVALLTLVDLLHDKLKLLNYERFCRQQNVAPPPAVFFSVDLSRKALSQQLKTPQQQQPPAAIAAAAVVVRHPELNQLHFFAKLAGWLAQEAGVSHQVDPYDAPATIAAAILDAVKATGADTQHINPVTVGLGFGISSCEALNCLVDAALIRREFTFEIPHRLLTNHQQEGLADGAMQLGVTAVEEVNTAFDSEIFSGRGGMASRHGARRTSGTPTTVGSGTVMGAADSGVSSFARARRTSAHTSSQQRLFGTESDSSHGSSDSQDDDADRHEGDSDSDSDIPSPARVGAAAAAAFDGDRTAIHQPLSVLPTTTASASATAAATTTPAATLAGAPISAKASGLPFSRLSYFSSAASGVTPPTAVSSLFSAASPAITPDMVDNSSPIAGAAGPATSDDGVYNSHAMGSHWKISQHEHRSQLYSRSSSSPSAGAAAATSLGILEIIPPIASSLAETWRLETQRLSSELAACGDAAVSALTVSQPHIPTTTNSDSRRTGSASSGMSAEPPMSLWRLHASCLIAGTAQLQQQQGEVFPGVSSMRADLRESLAAVRRREKLIGSELRSEVAKLAAQQQQLTALVAEQRSAQAMLDSHAETLQAVTESLEEVQTRLDERLSDTPEAATAKLRTARDRLIADISALDSAVWATREQVLKQQMARQERSERERRKRLA